MTMMMTVSDHGNSISHIKRVARAITISISHSDPKLATTPYHFNQPMPILIDHSLMISRSHPKSVARLSPFLEKSISMRFMKFAISGGILAISLSLRPSLRRWWSRKKPCKWREPIIRLLRAHMHWHSTSSLVGVGIAQLTKSSRCLPSSSSL